MCRLEGSWEAPYLRYHIIHQDWKKDWNDGFKKEPKSYNHGCPLRKQVFLPISSFLAAERIQKDPVLRIQMIVVLVIYFRVYWVGWRNRVLKTLFTWPVTDAHFLRVCHRPGRVRDKWLEDSRPRGTSCAVTQWIGDTIFLGGGKCGSQKLYFKIVNSNVLDFFLVGKKWQKNRQARHFLHNKSTDST